MTPRRGLRRRGVRTAVGVQVWLRAHRFREGDFASAAEWRDGKGGRPICFFAIVGRDSLEPRRLVGFDVV